MKDVFQQLKWQFVLLQKNNIIAISLGITLFYGLLLFAVRGLEYMDKFLIFTILTDPATIGFFFVGLGISIEYRHQILPALFVTPIHMHSYLLSRIIAISMVGWVCAVVLALLVLGLSFNVFHFSFGVLSISLFSALLGVICISYTYEFLTFALYSIPVFLFFVTIPLINYLGLIKLGIAAYVFPVQPGLTLIVNSYANTPVMSEIVLSYLLVLLWLIGMYVLAYRIFRTNILHSLM